MKLPEAERLIQEELTSIYGGDEARNIAALAIEHVTGVQKKDLLFNNSRELDATQTEVLGKIRQRLQLHEPIQYIMNKAWFYGLEIFVDSGVLIPRPETEELVDWIVNDVKQKNPDVVRPDLFPADDTSHLKILDVGTGSGCIALALKHALPRAEVWGCDISDQALNVARRNGAQLDIRVDFQAANFLDRAQQKQLPSVDILVSNPPYIPLRDKEEMQPNVLKYEPHTALFVEDSDPLIFYKALIQFTTHRLHANGYVYAEIHEDLADELKILFEASEFSIEIKKDMQGKNRMIRAFRA